MVELRFDGKEFERLEYWFRDGTPLFHQAVGASLRRTAQNMRKNIKKLSQTVSYLKPDVFNKAIGSVVFMAGGRGVTVFAKSTEEMSASVNVKARNQPAFKFKLSPNRITARKGRRSTSWQSPDVLKGPGLAPLNPRIAGFSRPFIARIGGRKAMYVRERHSGRLSMPRIASPQYFAAFEAVQGPVMEQAGQTFLKRLSHEIDYRLGALR